LCSSCRVCFFFQAEDGIRDSSVTGVQTCALPISLLVAHTGSAAAGNLKPESNSKAVAITVDDLPGAVPGRGSWQAVGELKDLQRSEERRVGKECRDRGVRERK